MSNSTFPTWRQLVAAMNPDSGYSFETLRAKVSNMEGGKHSTPVPAVLALVKAAGGNIAVEEGRYFLTDDGRKLHMALNTATT